MNPAAVDDNIVTPVAERATNNIRAGERNRDDGAAPGGNPADVIAHLQSLTPDVAKEWREQRAADSAAARALLQPFG